MHTQKGKRKGVPFLGVGADQLYRKLERWCNHSDPSVYAALHTRNESRLNAVRIAPWWLREAAQPRR